MLKHFAYGMCSYSFFFRISVTGKRVPVRFYVEIERETILNQNEEVQKGNGEEHQAKV